MFRVLEFHFAAQGFARGFALRVQGGNFRVVRGNLFSKLVASVWEPATFRV